MIRGVSFALRRVWSKLLSVVRSWSALGARSRSSRCVPQTTGSPSEGVGSTSTWRIPRCRSPPRGAARRSSFLRLLGPSRRVLDAVAERAVDPDLRSWVRPESRASRIRSASASLRGGRVREKCLAGVPTGARETAPGAVPSVLSVAILAVAIASEFAVAASHGSLIASVVNEVGDGLTPCSSRGAPKSVSLRLGWAVERVSESSGEVVNRSPKLEFARHECRASTAADRPPRRAGPSVIRAARWVDVVGPRQRSSRVGGGGPLRGSTPRSRSARWAVRTCTRRVVERRRRV